MKLELMTEQGVTGALLCISALPGEFSRLCSEYSGSQSLLPPRPANMGLGVDLLPEGASSALEVPSQSSGHDSASLQLSGCSGKPKLQ